jgi:hypothetical protein
MDRTEYNGDIFGTDNGVFFKLGVTVEEVRKAMEENKQLKALQEELASMDKMKFVIVDALTNKRVVKEGFVPRIGDSIGLFGYTPPPTVDSVLLWPTEHTLKGLGFEADIQAIVFC